MYLIKKNHINNVRQNKKCKISYDFCDKITRDTYFFIDKTLFLDLSHITILEFGDCARLKADILQYLPNLEQLSMYKIYDKICSVVHHTNKCLFDSKFAIYGMCESNSKNIFNPIKKIKTINISFNFIKYLDKSIFNELYFLTSLEISCNKIIQLHHTIFHNLINLEKIDLSNNLITYLNNKLFKNNKKLSYINLSRNKIIHLPPDLFTYISNDSYINLSYNKISYINDNVFNIHNIKYLDLRSNNIKFTTTKMNNILYKKNKNCIIIICLNPYCKLQYLHHNIYECQH